MLQSRNLSGIVSSCHKYLSEQYEPSLKKTLPMELHQQSEEDNLRKYVAIVLDNLNKGSRLGRVFFKEGSYCSDRYL